MKKIISLVSIVILFLGCGDSSGKTTGTVVSDQDFDVKTVMYVGETRELELNLDSASSYQFEMDTKNDASLVDHRINYSNLTRPILSIKALSAGSEKVYVTSTSPNNESKQVTVDVLVVKSNDSDIISGNPIDSNSTDGNTTDPGDGGTTDPDNGGNPPDIGDNNQATYDQFACAKIVGFNTVSDDYSTVEGKQGSDGGGYIRSFMIRHADSNVTLFYPTLTSYTTSPPRMYDFPRFSFTTIEGFDIIFDVQIANDIVGKRDYFYVDSNGYCLRGVIPSSSLTPPNRTLTWVVGDF